jgi:SAM-dependent methyltransferase
MDKVHDFWDKQAAEFGASDLATAPDHFYREMEIKRIIEHLVDGESILDVGCGNGYSTFKFADAFPKSRFFGLDYSEPMIDQARETRKGWAEEGGPAFIIGNVLQLEKDFPAKFDTIVSERCLINLANWEEQQNALLQMKERLKPDGRIILVENFMNGLRSLNHQREKFGLHPIEVRWHNRYLEMNEFLIFCGKHFDIEYEDNIGNIYYLLSRVLYAALAKREGKEPEYSHPINEIAAQLPSLGFYQHSPNWLMVLRAK